MVCENKSFNIGKCNCSYPGCPKKGICCECISYHRSRKELPACYFPENIEKTWDRSVKMFISINS